MSWIPDIYQVRTSPWASLKTSEVWETMVEVGMAVEGEKCGGEAEWQVLHPGGNWKLSVLCHQVCDQGCF